MPSVVVENPEIMKKSTAASTTTTATTSNHNTKATTKATTIGSPSSRRVVNLVGQTPSSLQSTSKPSIATTNTVKKSTTSSVDASNSKLHSLAKKTANTAASSNVNGVQRSLIKKLKSMPAPIPDQTNKGDLRDTSCIVVNIFKQMNSRSL